MRWVIITNPYLIKSCNHTALNKDIHDETLNMHEKVSMHLNKENGKRIDIKPQLFHQYIRTYIKKMKDLILKENQSGALVFRMHNFVWKVHQKQSRVF